jgi:hypothetical protein
LAVDVDVYVYVDEAQFSCPILNLGKSCGADWAEIFMPSIGTSCALSARMLAHEKLDVYRCAVEFLAAVGRMVDEMPCGTAVVRDQIDRASLSIVANIAEGVGVRTPKERDRHFGIARGSAMECGA